MVIPRADEFLHRLSTSRDEVRPRDGSRCRCSSTQHDADNTGSTDMTKVAVRVRGWACLVDSCHAGLGGDGGRSAARTAPRRSSGRLDRRHTDRRGGFRHGGTRDPPSFSTWTPLSGSPDTPSTSPYGGPPGTPTADPSPVERGSHERTAAWREGPRTPGTSRTDQQVGTRPLHTPKQIIRKLRRVSA